MKKIILAFILFIALDSTAQTGIKSGTESPASLLNTSDSDLQSASDTIQNLQQNLDNERMARENEQGLNELMREQDAYHAKQKKMAILRIVVGVLFLGVLVIGLRRRSKK